MELTKEQITLIDNYLKDKGVKYWDIRLEMIDHVVTLIEDRDYKSLPFNDAFELAIDKLKYNRGDLETQMKLKTKQFQNKYFKLQLKELKAFFIKLESLIPYSLFCAFLFLFHDNRFVIKSVMYVFLFGFSISIILSLINYEKIFKSINLLAITTFFIFASSIMNLLTFIPKIYIVENNILPTWYLSIIPVVIFPLFYTGFKIFFRYYKQYNKVYKKSISICN